MDQVILFDKSLQQRLQEYKEVLSGYEVLAVSSIAREWGYYLELSMDPSGWQAVWKIPRMTCEMLNIPFPSLVLVFVLNVDFKELEAFVKVIAVQDDIHIPEKHYVPLIQLWPTKEQDKSIALSIHTTANLMDMLRFFYTNIFMPWDQEDNDTTDWLDKHLESRLRLYYDVKNGAIPRPIAENLNSLLSEARRLKVKRNLIESQLVDSEIDIENPQNDKIQTLMDVHLRMMEIKSKVKILENPFLRDAVIRHQKESDKNKTNSVKQQTWLIHNEGKVDDFIEFLTVVKKHFPEALIKFSADLATVLETSNPNDIYVLNKFTHSIRTVGALENGGVLKGIADKCDTILTSKIENVMLDFNADNVLLENLTIDANLAQCAILVRRGRVLISNCKIVGDGKSSTHQGIIILAGGELEIIDSEITGFYSAIVGNSGSKIVLRNTEIHDVLFGLKIFDKCVLNAKKCTFRDCRNYGICVETESSLADTHKTGNFDLLSIIPDVNAEFLSGQNNVKGDVVINQKNKIKPLHDVFNETIVMADFYSYNGTSEEDMDIYESNDPNATVIEKKRTLSAATV